MVLVTTAVRPGFSPAAPRMAMLLASVAPPVKTISSGAAPIRAATSARACSTAVVGAAAQCVRRRRIAEVAAQERQHRLEDLRVDRGGRVVVEIDGRHASSLRMHGRCERQRPYLIAYLNTTRSLRVP